MSKIILIIVLAVSIAVSYRYLQSCLDHSGNLTNLQKDFKIRNIITEADDFRYKDIEFHSLPTGEYDNDNDNSLVYLLNFNGYRILFTGDISSSVEKQLIQRYGDSISISRKYPIMGQKQPAAITSFRISDRNTRSSPLQACIIILIIRYSKP